MNKFKVGDRVRRVKNFDENEFKKDSPATEWFEGTISEISGGRFIKFLGATSLYNSSNYELVKDEEQFAIELLENKGYVITPPPPPVECYRNYYPIDGYISQKYDTLEEANKFRNTMKLCLTLHTIGETVEVVKRHEQREE